MTVTLENDVEDDDNGEDGEDEDGCRRRLPEDDLPSPDRNRLDLSEATPRQRNLGSAKQTRCGSSNDNNNPAGAHPEDGTGPTKIIANRINRTAYDEDGELQFISWKRERRRKRENDDKPRRRRKNPNHYGAAAAVACRTSLQLSSSVACQENGKRPSEAHHHRDDAEKKTLNAARNNGDSKNGLPSAAWRKRRSLRSEAPVPSVRGSDNRKIHPTDGTMEHDAVAYQGIAANKGEQTSLRSTTRKKLKQAKLGRRRKIPILAAECDDESLFDAFVPCPTNDKHRARENTGLSTSSANDVGTAKRLPSAALRKSKPETPVPSVAFSDGKRCSTKTDLETNNNRKSNATKNDRTDLPCASLEREKLKHAKSRRRRHRLVLQTNVSWDGPPSSCSSSADLDSPAMAAREQNRNGRDVPRTMPMDSHVACCCSGEVLETREPPGNDGDTATVLDRKRQKWARRRKSRGLCTALST